MEIIDALNTLAEFSIGLAGFTGIIAIFANSRDRIGAALRFRITNLLALSFAPGFFALATLGLVYLVEQEATAIRITSAGIAAFSLLALTRGYRTRRKIPTEEKQLLSPFFWAFNIAVVALNFTAQVINVVFPSKYSAGIVVFGIISMLLVAAITFCMIVFQIMNSQGRSR